MSKFGTFGRAGALVLVTLATVVYGCGSSNQAPSAGLATTPLLKPEDSYRYEGEGENKKKVALSHEELMELRRAAKAKLQGK